MKLQELEFKIIKLTMLSNYLHIFNNFKKLFSIGVYVYSRATQPYIHMYPFSPKPQSRLPHNIEQSSLCYTVGPCWLSI